MTIRSRIDARALNAALESFERCADEAPRGTYEHAKQLATLIGETAQSLISGLREIGLDANNCDGIREVEAVIYGYIKDSNPDATVFPTAEGFGAALEGPARDRVLVQAVQNRDFLQRSFAAFGP
ncbi:hypothetical protein [Xanthomonas sp. D-99]|uniref:hypothetical protein n=1 Tax=Xanthomonas sp. D-99 TaxID=2821273 RepID=UPI001ADA9567|nr:hypothetical protein [Xanthomonas sp. D-99]MBO9878478.1 hypothetical protein [Xanthomonas sp. D-99]